MVRCLGCSVLVIAFTFSGAVTRFETRRDLIREEANDIGTAYLRLDLLPAARQPALRQDFRDYVQARLQSLNDRERCGFSRGRI